MPISEALNKEISDYARAKKMDELVNALRGHLIAGHLTVPDLLEYVTKYIFKEANGTQSYVVDAATINRLGVVVSQLENLEQKKLDVHFYQLAAERNSNWGNHNLAQCLLNGTIVIESAEKHALIYAKKAIELASVQEKHEHKCILCVALRANNERKNANIALVEYIDYQVKQSRLKAGQDISGVTQNIKNAVQLLTTIIKEFFSDFDEKNVVNLSHEKCKSSLDQLDPFLALKTIANDNSDARLALQCAKHLKSRYHEKLGELSEAMRLSCEITHNERPFYDGVIAVRVRLIKAQILKDLSEISPEDFEKINLVNKVREVSQVLLPNNVSLPIKFAAIWDTGGRWFHAVDELKIKEEYDKRCEQLAKLMSAKELEMSLIDERVKDRALTDEIERKKLSEQQDALKKQLESYRQIQYDLAAIYKNLLPTTREVYRRHVTEDRFFNPKRTKKRNELIELTNKIIDHRFALIVDPTTKPIDLTGKSARLYITAEKLFQNAVLALAGTNYPQLGIPTARKKSWSMGYDYDQRSGTTGFGPVEQYQVGETVVQSEHRTSPKRERLGDSFLPQHGTYNNDIHPFLVKISNENKEKEKQLAGYMIRFGRSHQPISLDELKVIYSEATKDDVDHFNRICFLIMEKEQAQWLSATDEKFKQGMSISQARCLIMIEAGFVSFREAFLNNALFGIYSHTGILNNPAEITKSCYYIDKLYMSFLQSKHPQDHFSFLKRHITDVRSSSYVATRHQAHQDMKAVYGGDGDTDDEKGYDSDLSM